MTPEETAALVRHAVQDPFNVKDPEAADRFYREDFHLHGWGREVEGRKAFRLLVGEVNRAFPDFVVSVWDTVAGEGLAMTRLSYAGTHEGTFLGAEPTGRRVAWSALALFRLDEEGQVAEQWEVADRLGLVQELGLLPAPERLAGGWSPATGGEREAPGDDPAGVVRRLIAEVVNGRRFSLIDELFAPDYLLHNPSVLDAERGPSGVRAALEDLMLPLPDLHQTALDIVVQGDKVGVRSTLTGTHSAEFAGVPPTGRPFSVPVMAIYRVAARRIAEEWEVSDNLALLEQLGLVSL